MAKKLDSVRSLLKTKKEMYLGQTTVLHQNRIEIQDVECGEREYSQGRLIEKAANRDFWHKNWKIFQRSPVLNGNLGG